LPHERSIAAIPVQQERDNQSAVDEMLLIRHRNAALQDLTPV
jgi:hypothetical protein